MKVLRPLENKIVVKPVDADSTSEGGIIIPEVAQQKQQKGIVISVGKGLMLDSGIIVPPDIKSGDEVLFGRYAGVEVTVGAEDLLIINESDILAVMEDAQ